MLASSIISNEIPPLKITDRCDKVLEWMDEFRVTHMPVFKGAEYCGLISEVEILDAFWPLGVPRDEVPAGVAPRLARS